MIHIDKSEYHPWKELLVGFQLEQMIAEPTRATDTTSTLIDHIYVSQKECIRATKVPKIAISDHYPTCAVWKLKFSQKQQHTHIKYRSMKNFNEQKFREDLREVPWHVLDIFDNPNDALSAWSTLFMDIVESHAPLRSRRVKHPKQPDWMTPDIIQAINERDRLKAAGFHNEVRILRNEVVGLIKEAKKVYYHTMIENQQKNSKALWSYLTDLTPKEKLQEPIFMSSDGKHVTDSAQISNLFNKHFVDIVEKYIPAVSGNVMPNLKRLKTFIESKINRSTKFTIPLITEEHVLKEISAMPTKEAVGIDGISCKLLKAAAPEIAQSVTKIINKSFTSGIFPDVWKTAKVTPVRKSGPLHDFGNFRPISVLPLLSKIIEKRVHSHFYSYLDTHGLLYVAQSGFRAMHSCETALLNLTTRWLKSMNDGLMTGVILLDLRKAFDLVNHTLLLEKLKLYQCCGKTLEWFTSYLNERKQMVNFKNNISDPELVKSGVPQGSILGPLLFILFMNDIPLEINEGALEMYADDSTVSVSGKTVKEIETKLNTSARQIATWCSENKMAVNVEKTKSLLVTTQQKRSMLKRNQQDQAIGVRMNGQPLLQIHQQKLLGVVIDQDLTWNVQVKNICNTVSRNLALFRRIKSYLPFDTRKLFYQNFIQVYFDYCSVVWGSSTKISSLLKLQKRAARLIYDLPGREHSGPLFKKLKWLPVQQRIIFKTAIVVYKALNGLAPKYMTDSFTDQNQIKQRLTRSSSHNNLYVPRSKLKKADQSISIKGSKIWNELPLNIRQSTSLGIFKRKAYQHYLDVSDLNT